MSDKYIEYPGWGIMHYDDARNHPRLKTDGVVQVDRAPVDSIDVARLSDLSDYLEESKRYALLVS